MKGRSLIGIVLRVDPIIVNVARPTAIVHAVHAVQLNNSQELVIECKYRYSKKYVLV